MKILESILFVIAVSIFGYIYYKKYISSATTTQKKDTSSDKVVENITPGNLVGRIKFKLVPYKEALETSRQFIFSIAKAVMEKFSPEAKETLLDLGTRLYKAGVQYIHVVDVFKISLDKQRAHTIGARPKEQSKGPQK